MRTSAPLLALVALALVALALVAAGCGGAGQSTSGTSTTAGPAGAIPHPAGARDVVVRVATGGGFIAVEASLATLPSYTLYGDGTVIRTAATPTGSAPALGAVPALETGRLDEAAIQRLLAAAQRAGLLAPGPIDYGDMGAVGVADMATTSVAFTADGRTAVRDAYGLGAGSLPGGHSLTAAQQAARAALTGFLALTRGPLPDARPFAAQRLAVYVAPGAAAGEAAILPVTADLAALAAAGTASAAGFGCTVVRGGSVPKLLAAIANPSPSGLWRGTAGGEPTYRVVVRPLLPDETGCAA